jgi:hypothetical protein
LHAGKPSADPEGGPEGINDKNNSTKIVVTEQSEATGPVFNHELNEDTMKTFYRTLLAGAVLAVAGPVALANTVNVLTFEGLQDQEPINNYYNGGVGGFGSGPGPNYGITFTSDSLALISASAGGSGNFANNPSGDTIAFFLSGQGDTMNVSGGFTTGFSFFYAAAFDGSVDVYDGPNGTGSVLAHLDLAATPDPYDVWVPIGVTFLGTAESVVFGGAANFIGFDDITLGSSQAGGGSATPEPATLTMLGMGVLSLAGYRRRMRKQAA